MLVLTIFVLAVSHQVPKSPPSLDEKEDYEGKAENDMESEQHEAR